MVVIVMRAVKPGLRGELSRWMLEISAGVFVGRLPARVREKLWQKIIDSATDGEAVIISGARNEQGFVVQTHGDPSRFPIDSDGLTLMTFRTSTGPKRPGRPLQSSDIEGNEQ